MQDLSTKTNQETATHMIYGISTDLKKKKTVSLYFQFHSISQPECLVLIYVYIVEA